MLDKFYNKQIFEFKWEMKSNAKFQMLDFVFTFMMVRFDVIGTVTFNISKIVTYQTY